MLDHNENLISNDPADSIEWPFMLKIIDSRKHRLETYLSLHLELETSTIYSMREYHTIFFTIEYPQLSRQPYIASL